MGVGVGVGVGVGAGLGVGVGVGLGGALYTATKPAWLKSSASWVRKTPIDIVGFLPAFGGSEPDLLINITGTPLVSGR